MKYEFQCKEVELKLIEIQRLNKKNKIKLCQGLEDGWMNGCI